MGTVTGSHAYTAAGVYRVTLGVTDSGGNTGQRTSAFIVVYDPNGGFVTGGGWINSPAGAYAADAELAGKATFGFVSKYPKGANLPPAGETQFQFSVADFKFESTVYEWLVISGAKARYRGTGHVNGGGSYGFELTAWDGQVSGGVDRFRIKIWDSNQGNGVVYDNQMGAADGADPTTLLGGGSIVIHKK
jgi:PKD repeat protein